MPSAHRFTCWQALQTTKQMRGEGSPDLLALATFCGSAVLQGSSHTFPLLSFPLLVISLPAKCTLPQELPCSCFVSFLSPQTSSPSVVQFQPALGSSCVSSPFTLILLPPAHRSRSNPNTHTTQPGVCTAPPAAFTSLVLTGISISSSKPKN